MKAILLAAVAVTLLPAAANTAERATIEPNRITVESKRPTLQLTEQQRAEIQNALATQNTQQKTPAKFEAKVGEAVPLTMTMDVMPPALVLQDPSLKQYSYAKLAKVVLVIDPLKKTIIAVLPRAEPDTGKPLAPADWAAKQGRTLTGQAPEQGSQQNAPEPAGDSGDKSNGTEAAPK
jgi:hypothetical protein